MQKRRKRAAPKDIYPACRISNTCPPDIVNKAEHNTLADKILKYGSAGVFLGSLGIGTGRGSGGTFGYSPVGGQGVQLGTRISTIRPTLPISSVGTTDVIPVDAIDPLGPVVLPSERFPVAVEDPVVLQPPRFPSVVDEPVTVGSSTETGVSEVPISTPKVTTDQQPAILEVTPETRPPRIISRSQYSNPTFEVSLTTSAGAGETSASDHIYVHGDSGGQYIGEEIELRDFHTTFSTTIEQETSFTTSTPKGELPPSRPSRFYNRRYEQVRVTDSAFVDRPRSLVTFDNPVFEDSVDIIFEQDLADLAQAAPHEDFRDVVTLTRPHYSRNPEGGIRISRFGQKASIRTRSGVSIGPQTHYFYDISEIAPGEEVELIPIGDFPLGESTGDTVIASGTEDFEVITIDSETIEDYPDEFLLDEIETVGDHLQLVLGSRREVRPVSVPRTRPSLQVYTDFTGVHVIHTDDSDASTIPIDPKRPPAVVIDLEGSDFFLHPSLTRRRKRKRLFL